MSQRSARHAIQIASSLAIGLFAGRVISEWFKPGLGGAVLLTVVTLLLAALLVPRIRSQYHWTALPLFTYVFYPNMNPRIALSVAGIVVICFLLQLAPRQRLGVPERRSRLGVALGIFVSFLLLYIITLAPDVLPADNGELQLVAAELGVAHPPGFALYTLLAHLATRLPFGPTAAYRANLLSAFTAAGTLVVIFLSVWYLTRRLAPGLLAAGALGTATTFWSQATTANVRSLTGLFAALAIFVLLIIRQRKEKRADISGVESQDNFIAQRPYIVFALLLSLGVTHHASLAFMGLIFGAYLLWLDTQLLRQPRRWVGPILGLLAGLLPLLYFPLRARADVPGASPALATMDGFLQHILALGFRGDLFAFSEPAQLWARLKIMSDVMLFQFHPLLLAGMVAGIVLLLWRERKLAFLLAGSFALHTLITATYRAPQTVEYMLPAYVPAVLALGYGAGVVQPKGELLRAIHKLLIATLLVVVVGQGLGRFSSFDQLAHDRSARAYATTILEGAPEDSVVLADWHWATPLWYVQEVENVRPDLEIHYVFPTAEEYDQTWARRIADAYENDRPVVATHYDPGAYDTLPVPQPLGSAFLFAHDPPASLPATYRPLDIVLGEQLELLGYKLLETESAPTYETELLVAWRPLSTLQEPVNLFVHLVGIDGALYAQQDLPLRAQPEENHLTRFNITPRPGALPGDYNLFIGAYGNAGEALLAQSGENRTQLTTVTLGPMPSPLATNNSVYLPSAAAERILVGFDWDNTLTGRPRLYLHWQVDDAYVTEVQEAPSNTYTLPPIYGPWAVIQQGRRLTNNGGYYVPLGAGIVWTGEPGISDLSLRAGQRVVLGQQFVSSRPVLEDYVVSVRLVGYQADNVHWAWWYLDDNVPAMGAIPTLKWIERSHINDPHFLTVATEAEPGQTVGGLLQLYDAFTQQSLPILDERISQNYLGIPLGTTSVQLPSR